MNCDSACRYAAESFMYPGSVPRSTLDHINLDDLTVFNKADPDLRSLFKLILSASHIRNPFPNDESPRSSRGRQLPVCSEEGSIHSKDTHLFVGNDISEFEFCRRHSSRLKHLADRLDIDFFYDSSSTKESFCEDQLCFASDGTLSAQGESSGSIHLDDFVSSTLFPLVLQPQEELGTCGYKYYSDDNDSLMSGSLFPSVINSSLDVSTPSSSSRMSPFSDIPILSPCVLCPSSSESSYQNRLDDVALTTGFIRLRDDFYDDENNECCAVSRVYASSIYDDKFGITDSTFFTSDFGTAFTGTSSPRSSSTPNYSLDNPHGVPSVGNPSCLPRVTNMKPLCNVADTPGLCASSFKPFQFSDYEETASFRKQKKRRHPGDSACLAKPNKLLQNTTSIQSSYITEDPGYGKRSSYLDQGPRQHSFSMNAVTGNPEKSRQLDIPVFSDVHGNFVNTAANNFERFSFDSSHHSNRDTFTEDQMAVSISGSGRPWHRESLKTSSRGEKAISSNRYPGVSFSAAKDVWRARITLQRRQYESQFSVKKFGYEEAMRQAVAWRASKEAYYDSDLIKDEELQFRSDITHPVEART